MMKNFKKMSYEIIGHTADIRLLVKGSDIEDLFAEALKGMTDILEPKISAVASVSSHKIKINSPDETTLLIDFLNELLSLSQIKKEIYSLKFLKISGNFLEAELEGKNVEEFGEDIKAVTYHEAGIKKVGGLFETMIVFDI